MIHTITAYPAYRDSWPFPEPRTFGYFLTRDRALDAVARDEGSMHECLYIYLVIEAIAPGIHSVAGDEAWFYYDQGAWQPVRGNPCERPEWARGVCNHSMG